jgi:hypothetical protein
MIDYVGIKLEYRSPSSHLNPRADINLTSRPLAICIVAAMCAQIRADGDPFLQTSYDAERVGQRNRCLRRLGGFRPIKKFSPCKRRRVQLVNLRRTAERRPMAYTVKVESFVWALAEDGVVCSVLKF